MLGKALFTALALAASALAQQGFDGVTEPINQARVGFTVSGKIDSIWVKEGALATLAGVTAKTLLQPLRPAFASGPLPLAAGLPPAGLGQARFPVTAAGRFPQPAEDTKGTHCPSGEVSQRTQRHILSHCLHSLLRPLCTAWPGADASRNVPARL